MASGFAKPITIKEAVDNIFYRKYLLPAIQRKFVWTSEQIETLFDSIMRGYPINSFMFWKINSPVVKNSFKFYQFLTDYRQFFNDVNPTIDTKGMDDFFAIIDGQQRLTSLYIGLKGTYAYKMPRKWLRDDQECLPTRKLYLNLASPALKDKEDRLMKYDFRFLTETESKYEDEKTKWYLVNEILRWQDDDEFFEYIQSEEIFKVNQFARQTINKLRTRIFKAELINYYLEENDDIDEVLDIFIRTNSGGQPLSFSNLLMSYTTANWTQRDARSSIDTLIKQVYGIGNPNFIINADLILKTCLVLFNENIRFQIKNFNEDNVARFEQNWDSISSAIVDAFKLIASWGFNESNFKAKNAIIPIVYFIYYNNLQGVINNPSKLNGEFKKVALNIRQWLCISLLKGIFGSQGDTVLTKIKNVLKNHKGDRTFPIDEIKEAFKGDTSKDMSFSEESIDELLRTQKDDRRSDIILALLYSHLNFDQALHKDHLHPNSYFGHLKKGNLTNKDIEFFKKDGHMTEEEFEFIKNMTDEEFAFFTDPTNYNSILNLEYLNDRLNVSRQNTRLDTWVKDMNIDLDTQLIPKNVSLNFIDFKSFIEARKELLKSILRSIVGSNTTDH